MCKRLTVFTVAVLVAAATGLLAVHAQPVATISQPEPGGTKELYEGCNAVALTFPNGTSSQAVANAVSPAGSVQAIWSYNTAQQRFTAFSPSAPQASDLLSVNFLDAVWVCVAGATPPPATIPPTVTAPPLPVPTAQPSAATTYEGTHSAGGTVKFRVSADGRQVEWFLAKGFCGLQTNELHFPSMPITGSHFYYETPYYDGFRIVNGNLLPSGEASGIINFGACHGDVPWTAYAQVG